MKNIILKIILFCCLTQTLLAQNKIKQYEYWLDNNYAGKQIVSVTPAAYLNLNAVIPNSGLSQGLHSLNFRFLDDSSRYSTIITQLIEAFSSSPQIASYEYWFDDVYSNKTLVPVAPSSILYLNAAIINASTLADGMHFFNIRFSDLSGKWSSVQRSMLFKSGNSTVLVNTISGYRYWIDNDIANNIYVNITPSLTLVNLNESINLTGLPIGNHVFNIQLQDISGLWSPVIRQNIDINVNGGNLTQNSICGYRYWLDSSFVNAIEKPVTLSPFVDINDNIDLSAAGSGQKIFNIQFKDTMGLWSSVVTDTISIIDGLIEETSKTCDIDVFPNPFTNSTMIVFNIEKSSEVKLAIFDVTGNKVKELSNKYPAKGKYSITINSTDIGNKTGIYYFRILSDEINVTKKITLLN
jgi:hypothetical protein